MYPGQPGFNGQQQYQQQQMQPQQMGQPQQMPQQMGMQQQQPNMQPTQFPGQGMVNGMMQQMGQMMGMGGQPQQQFQRQPMGYQQQPQMQQQMPPGNYQQMPPQQFGGQPMQQQQMQMPYGQQPQYGAQGIAQQQYYAQMPQQQRPQMQMQGQFQQPQQPQPNMYLQNQNQALQQQVADTQKQLEAAKDKERRAQTAEATKRAYSHGIAEGQAEYKQKIDEESQAKAAMRATIHDNKKFDAQKAASDLRKAMKGFGCDTKTVVTIVGSCSNQQRQQIISTYAQTIKRDLIKDLKSELSGNTESLVKSLMRTPASYDSSELRKAMKGVGCDKDTLIEIICTRPYSHLEQVKKEFAKEYSRDLVDDVRSETSTWGKSRLQDLLNRLLTSPRDDSVNPEMARTDALELKNAGEDIFMGTDQGKFIDIFSARSLAHLDLVFKEYQKISKFDIVASIRREMSRGNSNLAKALKAIVFSVRDQSAFFAEILKDSMEGVGTRERQLIRVVVSRSEIDLADIKDKFARDVGKGQTLSKWVKDDTNGNFQDLLLMVIEGNKGR